MLSFQIKTVNRETELKIDLMTAKQRGRLRDKQACERVGGCAIVVSRQEAFAVWP